MISTRSIFYENQSKQLNLWWQGVLILSALFFINALLYFIDHRLLADEALWIKPLKFEISIIIHFITLASLAALLNASKRNSLIWKKMTYMVVAAGVFEALYIFLQATRERESHYNNDTVIEAVMYGLMGLGALILVAGSFYLGYLLYREYLLKRSSPLLLSSALGLTIGSVLTLIVAGYLSSHPLKDTIGTTIDTEVLRLPIFSWYLNGKDLRIPHFFATHMMQLLPLYGYWLSQKGQSIKYFKQHLYCGAAIYTLMVIVLFIVAVM